LYFSLNHRHCPNSQKKRQRIDIGKPSEGAPTIRFAQV
jgi:hypothetical protein